PRFTQLSEPGPRGIPDLRRSRGLSKLCCCPEIDEPLAARGPGRRWCGDVGAGLNGLSYSHWTVDSPGAQFDPASCSSVKPAHSIVCHPGEEFFNSRPRRSSEGLGPFVGSDYWDRIALAAISTCASIGCVHAGANRNCRWAVWSPDEFHEPGGSASVDALARAGGGCAVGRRQFLLYGL